MKTRLLLMLVGLAGVGTAVTLAFLLPGSRPADVVLITVDTLRADHLGAYGAQNGKTPHIDRLAKDGTLFENAACPMPLTRPSIASLLTSRYPRDHGVLNNTTALPKEALSLAEILKGLGYHTGAFLGMVLLGPDSGVTQGFDQVVVPRPEQVMAKAARVVTRALSWRKNLPPDEPTFLWIHLFDPHQPYSPPEPLFRYGLNPGLAREYPGIYWNNLIAIAEKNQGDIPEEILGHAKALYRGEVAYTDHWIGKLLKGLGNLDESIIVFTADHGECFENGSFFEHATCLQDGATRIPLIVRYPPVFARDERVKTQASIIDIAPTILKTLGQPIPTDCAGQDLGLLAKQKNRRVLLQYPIFHPRISMWHQNLADKIKSVAGQPTRPFQPGLKKQGLIDPAWKYLTDGKTEELYRLSPQLDETNNRAIKNKEVVDSMRQELKRLAPASSGPAQAREIPKDQLEQLRSLGYVQ